MNQTAYIIGMGSVPIDKLCGWGVWHSETDFDYAETIALYHEMSKTISFPQLQIRGAMPITGARSMLWEVVRKVLGQDTVNFPQQVGDCVSFGAKNAIEYVQVYPMANGQRRKFKNVFPPYLYGTGRVQVGGGRLGRQDGSMGGWQAEAVMKYGTIPVDTPNLPPYSGSVARKWGAKPGPPEEFLAVGKQFIVKSAALVATWDDVVTALTNGYPCTIASNVGFDMEPRSDGFHHHSTSWAHQMAIIGVDNESSDPHACILNSWGCFSDDTEILTEIGWILFKDLPTGLRVATLNQDTFNLEYEVPTQNYEYRYDGELLNFHSRDIDQLVTPNHRIFYCPVLPLDSKWRFGQADSLIRTFKMKKDCQWIGEEVDTHTVGDKIIPMDDWLEFLGYYLSEGYASISKRVKVSATNPSVMANWGYGRRVGICQTKIDNISKIQACMDRLPFQSHRTSRGWVFSRKDLYQELSILGKASEKFIPSYTKSLSARQQRILFDAMMLGDGSYGPSWKYYTSSKQLADDFQELLLKIGLAGDIHITDRIGRDNGTGGITRSIEYTVGIKRVAITPKVNSGWIPILIPYHGNVYCVSVPNETVYVRRNGKACWSGNSVHGQVKDFNTSEIWPAGTLRVRKKDIEKILRERESYAFSAFDGFPAQSLPREAFDF